jgi:hypothetical protein
MKRLLMVAALAVVALVLAFGMLPPVVGQRAEKTGRDSWAGEWLMDGDAGKPCAVFRQGDVLLVVNEEGSVGSARVIGPKKIKILKGDGWEAGLTGELHDDGKAIIWTDGRAKWKRR